MGFHVAHCGDGHRPQTRGVFDRYNIVSEGNLLEAARKMGRNSVTIQSRVAIPANIDVAN